MCSDIGVCMLLVGAGVALLRRGWRASLRVAVVPAAVYLGWLAWVGVVCRRTRALHHPGRQVAALPVRLSTSGPVLTDALQGATGLVGLGGVLALGLTYWLVRSRRLARGQAAFAFVAPVVAAAFFAIVGVGRVSLGVSEAGSERYSYVWIVLLLPAAALALSQLARRWAPGRWLTVVLAAVVAVNGIGGLAGYADANAPLQQREMGEILGAAHLLTSGAPLAVGGGAEVEVLNSPNLSVADLRSMIAAGKIPMNTPITAADTLAAALYLQVAFTLTPPTTAATAPMLENDVLPLPAMTAGGCVSVADGTAPSNLQLVFTAPGWVAVTPTESGAVSVRLAPRSAPLDLTSAAYPFAVSGGQTVYVLITAAGTAPLFSLPPGETTVCGVAG